MPMRARSWVGSRVMSRSPGTDPAVPGRQKPHRALDRRGLARAVAADQADSLARADAKGDALEDVSRPAVGVDALQIERGRGAGLVGRPAVRGVAHAAPWLAWVPRSVIDDLLVPADLVRGAGGEDRALVHGDDAVGVAEHDVHVVLDHHRGDPLRAHDGRDDVHDRRLLPGADAARRLVEEQELRPERIGHARRRAASARPARWLRRASRSGLSRPNWRSTATASSRTAPSRSASVHSQRVFPWRAKMVRATLSRTVSWSNRFTSWKLRAMPARIRSLIGLARDVLPLEHEGAADPPGRSR